MTIAFPCEKCGHRYELDSSLAGRRGKCKTCGHVFVIPVPQEPRATANAARTAAPATKVKKAAPPAPRESDPYYGDDPYGFDEELSPPKGSLRPVEAHDDEEFLPPRAAKPVELRKKKKRRSGGGDGFSMEDLPFAVFKYGMFAVLGTLVLYVFGVKVGLVATLVVFGMVTVTLSAIGQIGMLVVPFQESAACGLMTIFIPFYSLYYLITRWDAMARWFLTSLASVGMFVVAGFFALVIVLPSVVSMDEIRLAVERQQAIEAQKRGQPGQNPGMPNVGGADTEEERPGLAMNPGPNFPAPPNFPGAQGFGNPVGGPPRVPAPPKFEIPAGIPAPSNFRKPNNPAANARGGMAGRPNAGKPPARGPMSEKKRLAMAPKTVNNAGAMDAGMPRGNGGGVDQSREEFLDAAIRDLQSLQLDDRSRALKKLQSAPPVEDRREEVAAAIEPMLSDPNSWGRMDAAKALAVWGGPENTPALSKALKDPEFVVRWAVLDAIKELKDPAAAEETAKMLTKDRQKASEALQAMGPGAESAVIPYLKSSDVFVKVEACKILQEIGAGEDAKAAIFDMGRRVNGQGLDGMAAKSALDVLGYPKTSSTKPKGIVPRSTPKRK